MMQACKRARSETRVMELSLLHAPRYLLPEKLNRFLGRELLMPLRRSGHPPAVSPQAVGSYVLGDLLHRAAAYLGHTQVSKAIIAVPAKFDARQRAATVEAFSLAGLKVCPRCPAE